MEHLKEALWQQFGAAISMLSHAITHCPATLWDDGSHFWYRSYHILFYLDYYSSTDPDQFHPPAPFNLSEFDADGKLPDRVYTKEELLTYLQFGRQKVHDLIASFTEKSLQHRFINVARNYSRLEIVMYNMRHTQHHVGQLNLLLRQYGAHVPQWISDIR